MNNMELIITDEAYNDIDSISNYILKDNIQISKSVVDELFNTLYTSTEFPNIGKYKYGIKDNSVKIFIHKKQYLIAYKIFGNSLIILRILTNYQDIFAVLN